MLPQDSSKAAATADRDPPGDAHRPGDAVGRDHLPGALRTGHSPAPDRPPLTVGDWRVRPSLHRLTSAADGATVQLEPKVMAVLLRLAEQPRRVVSKGELMAAVWPDAHVVDAVLTRAVSELRKALGDEPQRPRYIETVRKGGYRLIAPVGGGRAAAAVAGGSAAAAPAPRDHRRLPPAALAVAAALVLLLTVGVTALRWRDRAGAGDPSEPAAPMPQPRPVTSFPGLEVDPTIDGEGRIAFVRSGELLHGARAGNGPSDADAAGAIDGLYIALPGSPSPLRLTGDGGDRFPVDADLAPAFSPPARSAGEAGNGRLAFIRFRQSAPPQLVTMPALGGPAEVIAELADVFDPHLAWVPDDRFLDGWALVVSQRQQPEKPYSLTLVPVAAGTGGGGEASPAETDDGTRSGDGGWRRLTRPPAGVHGDLYPAVSPDGRYLAFSRAAVVGRQDLFLVDLASGREQRLTRLGHHIEGIAWEPDGGALLFAMSRSGAFDLWRLELAAGDAGIVAAAGAPRPLGLPGAQRPAISPSGDLVFEQRELVTTIWQLPLPASGGLASGGLASGGLGASGPGAAEPLLRSTRIDAHPHLAPDGRIAFVSSRSGSLEVWIAEPDGANPRQLTHLGGTAARLPRWSPDGRRLAFEVAGPFGGRVERGSADGPSAGGSEAGDGGSDIYLLDDLAGTPRRLTAGTDGVDEQVPSWSADGRWIYFAANRGGDWQVYKLPAGGGEPVQVTRDGGYLARESPDGRWLYFTRADRPGLWRQPAAGGPAPLPEQVLTDLDQTQYGNWAIAADGAIYHRSFAHPDRPNLLLRVDPETGETRELTPLPGLQANPGLALAADGSRLLFTRIDRLESDLMMIEGWAALSAPAKLHAQPPGGRRNR